MENIKVTKTIDSQKEQVWNAIKNFQGVGAFHPYVKAVSLISDDNEGLGAERICHFYDGSNYHEKVTRYLEGEEMDVTILSGLPGIMAGTPNGTLSVKDIDGNSTTVSMNMSFNVKYGIVGKIMAKTVMKSQFKKLLTNVLNGLDVHVRTGGIIGKVLKNVDAEKEQAEAPKILATINNSIDRSVH